MTAPVTTPAPPGAPPTAPGRRDDVTGRALDLSLLARLFPFVSKHRRALVVSVALLPVISAFEVAQPYLLKLAIDEHIAPGKLAGLDRLGFLYLLALVGQYLAAFAHNYLVQVVGQRAMGDLRLAVHRHALRLSASFFDRTPVGQLMTRMTNDIESLTEMFASGIVSLLGDVVRLGLIIVVMFRTDATLALYSMAAVPVLAAVAAFFRGWVRDAFREIRAKLSRMNGYLQEHLSGIKVVQAFAQETRAAREFDVINREYRDANARAIAADAALYSVVEAVGAIAVAALLWHGGARIAAGGLTFGVLVQFIEYMGKFFAPLRDLSAKYTVMQQATAAAERVFALLDTKDFDASPPPAATGTAVAGDSRAGATGGLLPPPRPGIAALELDHVTFGYRTAPAAAPPLSPSAGTEGADAAASPAVPAVPAVPAGQAVPPLPVLPCLPILRDLSLTIATGETVAIVGTTGAGKSTLIKLLTRLYRPQSGVIRLNGQDVVDLDVTALRRHVVVVSQDVFLFSGTLGDNIGLGDPQIDEDRMWQAARRVGADRVIDARAGGLAAAVVERGANFSAGERQLIAFARALCRDPGLLILDEATASVDPRIERLIEQGIAELMRGRTSIVIAHRLSTIRRANRIVVIDRGTVVEEGDHDALFERRGIYWRLYQLQMQAGRDRAGHEAAQ